MKRGVAGLALALFCSAAAGFDEVGAVNPDLAARLCEAGQSVTYLARDKSYRLVLPEIGKRIYLADRDIAPKITAHMEMSEWTNGFLFIVSTRIRDDLPQDASVLDRVEARMQGHAERFKDFFSGRRGTSRFGRTFEYEFLNVSATGLTPYPLSFHMPPKAKPDTVERVAAHRYLVANGYLFEFAAMLHTKKELAGMPKADLIAKARQWLDLALAGFTPGAVEACPEAAKQAEQAAKQ